MLREILRCHGLRYMRHAFSLPPPARTPLWSAMPRCRAAYFTREAPRHMAAC